jgi:shikimate dehydrogenase
VLGHPVGHSLSPVLHTAAYTALGLTDWSYESIDCTEDGFADWFAGLGPDWRGLSLTMPLKRVAIPLLHSVSDLARAVGAVNTVTWDDAGRSVGRNTDVYGIVEALRSVGVEKVGSASVLGAGATACSAVGALAELGARSVQLQARSVARAGEALAAADRLGVEASVIGLDQIQVALDAEVVVSTLPAEAAATWADSLVDVLSHQPPGVLLDVTYHPWPTPLAAAWTAAGGTAVGGFEMLLHQAGSQFMLMTGHPAPMDAMRAAGEKALGAANY